MPWVKPETALATWQQAEQAYQQAQDESGQLGAQLNQAQALQAMGLFRRAQRLLDDIDEQLQVQPNSELKVLGLESLGAALRVTGDLRQSQTVLEQSLETWRNGWISLTTSAPPCSVLAIPSGPLGQSDQALQTYQQSARQAPTPLAQLEAHMNQLSLLIETQNWPQAQALWNNMQPHLAQLSPSRKAIYVQVNGATSAIELLTTTGNPSPAAIVQLLQTAAAQARQLQDVRSEAYALGQLGYLYEQTQQWQLAQETARLLYCWQNGRMPWILPICGNGNWGAFLTASLSRLQCPLLKMEGNRPYRPGDRRLQRCGHDPAVCAGGLISHES